MHTKTDSVRNKVYEQLEAGPGGVSALIERTGCNRNSLYSVLDSMIALREIRLISKRPKIYSTLQHPRDTDLQKWLRGIDCAKYGALGIPAGISEHRVAQ